MSFQLVFTRLADEEYDHAIIGISPLRRTRSNASKPGSTLPSRSFGSAHSFPRIAYRELRNVKTQVSRITSGAAFSMTLKETPVALEPEADRFLPVSPLPFTVGLLISLFSARHDHRAVGFAEHPLTCGAQQQPGEATAST